MPTKSKEYVSKNKDKLREYDKLRYQKIKNNRNVEKQIWYDMLQRCNNPNRNDYKYYGMKGIKVCERWYEFENFISDMGLRPSNKHSIDRFPDKTGNYEPSNCRWATAKEQANNKTNSISVNYEGNLISLKELSKIKGINYGTMLYRYHKKLPLF